GMGLRPVLEALSVWGTPLLGERRTTDAVRAHWFALPLGRAVAEVVPTGTVTVHIGETTLHYVITDDGLTHHDGAADEADLEVHLDLDVATDVAKGTRVLTDILADSPP
ncbi:transcriptional regulator, partial [Nocardia cyriacigeorgica]|nr:transcriptional regulator [Nocardia cyriacigeorgica]NEW58642.1 transcriptional regulator [Nocardia cyriacigeorgica]